MIDPQIEKRNTIGSVEVFGTDNLAIALASYFEDLPDCPENDVDDELGWSRWAIAKTNEVLSRIVDLLDTL